MNFSYDHLNRLVSFGNSQLTYDHEGKGNIVANSSIGQFAYGTNKPYQLIGAVDQGNQIPLKDQDIVYNTMLRPVSITQHEYNALFTYDSAGDRVRMQLNEDDTGILSRYYIDNTYEIESGVGTNKEFLYLDGDAYSASSVYVKENGSWNLYYIFRDYLGSITHLTDAGGVVVEENSYDAWGRLRDPQTQVLFNDDNQPALFLRRGYTSHEHLPWFGLTNMNARLYDPVLGRFLSPDPYVQMPDFSQNFNRYAYALNNPLKYIDQSGESFLGAVILGAIIGGIINLNVNAANVTSYGDMFAYFGMGALAGGLGAAAGAGIAPSVGGGFFGGAISGGAAGFTGGFVGSASNAWYNGASFGDGLLSGLKSGARGGLIGGAVGGLARGISDYKRGFKFWDGSQYNFIDSDFGGNIVKYEGAVAENDTGLLKDRMKEVYNLQEGDYGIQKITTESDGKIKVNTSGTYTDVRNNKNYGGYAKLISNGSSELHVSPRYATGDMVDFKAIAGHEAIHSYHMHIFPRNVYNGVYSERVAYSYTTDVYKTNGRLLKAIEMTNRSILLNSRGPVPMPYQYIPFIHK